MRAAKLQLYIELLFEPTFFEEALKWGEGLWN
jgi:hypothetical protein